MLTEIVNINRRDEILKGKLSFPKQIIELLDINEIQQSIIETMFQHLWHNFLKEQKSDTMTWLYKLDNNKLFNILLTHLSRAGWITSNVESNYAFLEINKHKILKWISEDELIEIRLTYKFLKYRLDAQKSTFSDKTKIVNTYKKTGLIRTGFMKAGNNKFTYDTKYMQEHLPYIAKNTLKGLADSIKDITYQEVIEELLNYYSTTNRTYTLGQCINDSRGRAIYQCTKKIFNPISNKDARALIICKPSTLTIDATKNIFMAITELLGNKYKSIEDKISYGEEAWCRHTLLPLENMINTDNYSDLHKIIWLSRIYDNLDNYDGYNWIVPIELDATASLIQIIGVLTNTHDYMKHTNLLGDELNDIWNSIEGVPRKHAKKAYTPILYGSSQSIKSLWDDNKLEYTQDMLNKANKALKQGIFKVAINFKDFVINNVKPKVTMEVNINNEIFTIECNRFKWEETIFKEYSIFTSSQEHVRKITREVALIPDTANFKRYFLTLLAHNLDSQIANNIADKINWVLPNHDSFIINPNDTEYLRLLYLQNITEIYNNRHNILNNYFKSIGINKEYKDTNIQLISNFSGNCLK